MPTLFIVRPYEPRDEQRVIGIYQAAFAEPPWNETWSYESVKDDLEFGRQQPGSVVLVAENGIGVVGFLWGYRYPQGKYPQLEGIMGPDATYLDDVAVIKDKRVRGIGSVLVGRYLRDSRAMGFNESILRTSPQNEASVPLFEKFGYRTVQQGGKTFIDPAYNGIYMRVRL